MNTLFPLEQYWSFYLGFVLLVLVFLILDLAVFHRKAHEVSVRESAFWTVFWMVLAFFFNGFFYAYVKFKLTTQGVENADALAWQSALEFLTGYIVEKSLAIDNIFIFAVVFSYFGIPKIYQHRILFWGILGALVFRAIFIAMGSLLMRYESVLLIFGILLMLTGLKMFFSGTQEEKLENNALIRLLKRILPVHPQLEGQKFLVKRGRRVLVTPLFLALIFLELTDVIFAVDSVPAIFAITKEPLIVFTSNIFAMLGLRSLYFMLSGIMTRFAYIKYGLAGVLIFVGSKMAFLNSWFGGKFPIHWSLLIIAGLVGGSIFYSLLAERRSLRQGVFRNIAS